GLSTSMLALTGAWCMQTRGLERGGVRPATAGRHELTDWWSDLDVMPRGMSEQSSHCSSGARRASGRRVVEPPLPRDIGGDAGFLSCKGTCGYCDAHGRVQTLDRNRHRVGHDRGASTARPTRGSHRATQKRLDALGRTQ